MGYFENKQRETKQENINNGLLCLDQKRNYDENTMSSQSLEGTNYVLSTDDTNENVYGMHWSSKDDNYSNDSDDEALPGNEIVSNSSSGRSTNGDGTAEKELSSSQKHQHAISISIS